MSDHPTIFTGDSVRSMLRGDKTQTRRVVTWRNSLLDRKGIGARGQRRDTWDSLVWSQAVTRIDHRQHSCWDVPSSCYYRWCVHPRVQPGDRLWVKETWAVWPPDGDEGTTRYHIYRADGERDGVKWRLARYMPRAASRLTLDVTDVRAQWVQDISREDAIAEGVELGSDFNQPCPVTVFSGLWDTINGKRHPWANNPPAWVHTFKIGDCDEARDD